MPADPTLVAFPTPLADYPSLAGQTLADVLASRLHVEPFNGIATAIFALAIVHTFAASAVTARAQRVQQRHDATADRRGAERSSSLAAEALHLLGEVEVVFGLWAVALMIAIAACFDWGTATHYLNDTVDYTEALFVTVIMAIAASGPIVALAESMLRRIAGLGGASPAAWWLTTLTVAPVFGSLITEPAAMTIAALLLGRQFYSRRPSHRLMYATLGLLFVNVSIGGTLTHFAAPPVLMVADAWHWNTPFMLSQFGWKAALAIAGSTFAYYLVFRRELSALATRRDRDIEAGDPAPPPPPAWLTMVHLLFLAWTVVNAHEPALFIGGFLFFLGVVQATAAHQKPLELRTPLLVGFFLAGLVVHGRLQQWWIEPVLRSLNEAPLFLGATFLTAFNDNALITYLATLVPDLSPELRAAVVQGAVTGGGLTVIANAPNPAGQALLRRYFDPGVSPLWLAAGALFPTLIAAGMFRLL